MSKEFHVHVENVRCGGCARSIVNSLKTIAGVDDVQVDLEHQHVQVLGDDDVGTRVQERLQAMGYLSMKPGVGNA